MASEQGEADAQYNLGVCYGKGQGVTQVYEEAVKWYRLAAEQGHADAQFNLGVCYDNGQGVAQDYEEAVKWYRMAAEQGNAGAQCKLGCCYYNEQGVTQDIKEAYKWLLLACSNCSNDDFEKFSVGRDTAMSKLSQSEITQAQNEAKLLQDKIDSMR